MVNDVKWVYAPLVKYLLSACVGLLQHKCVLTSQRKCVLMWSSHGMCVCPCGLFTACVCADVVYSQHMCMLMWSIHSTCVCWCGLFHSTCVCWCGLFHSMCVCWCALFTACVCGHPTGLYYSKVCATLKYVTQMPCIPQLSLVAHLSPKYCFVTFVIVNMRWN